MSSTTRWRILQGGVERVHSESASFDFATARTSSEFVELFSQTTNTHKSS